MTVAPCVDAFDDSMAALKFADRARNISNKAVVNSMHDTETILALKVGNWALEAIACIYI